MAQQLTCDICQEEPAVQMLTNITDGNVMMLGGACAPTFYSMSLQLAMGLAEHSGPPTKCQTCKAIHAQMTGTVTPLGAGQPVDDNQPGDVDEHTETASGQ